MHMSRAIAGAALVYARPHSNVAVKPLITLSEFFGVVLAPRTGFAVRVASGCGARVNNPHFYPQRTIAFQKKSMTNQYLYQTM